MTRLLIMAFLTVLTLIVAQCTKTADNDRRKASNDTVAVFYTARPDTLPDDGDSLECLYSPDYL